MTQINGVSLRQEYLLLLLLLLLKGGDDLQCQPYRCNTSKSIRLRENDEIVGILSQLPWSATPPKNSKSIEFLLMCQATLAGTAEL